MREILFRGKSTVDGTWVVGFLDKRPSPIQIGDCSPWFIHTPPRDPDDCDRTCNVIPESIGQYTGLKDKTGEKIFDGDILRYRLDEEDGSFSYSFYDVFWNVESGRWCDGSFYLEPCELDADSANDLTIVGNVYDSPRFLEADAE